MKLYEFVSLHLIEKIDFSEMWNDHGYDHGWKEDMGVSENAVYYPKPNGFADHYPVFKWLFHWEYTPLFSDKPIWN